MKRFKIIHSKNNQLFEKKSFYFIRFRFLKKTFFKKNNFESLRRLLSRKVKKKIKYSFNKKTNKFPLYKKSQKSRMGKGKGKFNN
jgi:ribosomal protein L16/L10AE